MLFVEQACPKQDVLSNCAVYPFAEPEGWRVTFFRVVNRFERLRTNALHIPEVEKFMRGDADELVETSIEVLPGQSNRGAVGVLHPATTGRFGKMINEHVVLKRTVVHPCCLRSDYALDRGNDLVEDALSIISIYDHAIFSAGRIEVPLTEIADLHWRVNKLVVVGR